MDKRKEIIKALEGFRVERILKDFGNNGDYLGIAIKLFYKNKEFWIRYNLLEKETISIEDKNSNNLFRDKDDRELIKELEEYLDEWIEEHIVFGMPVFYDGKEVKDIF